MRQRQQTTVAVHQVVAEIAEHRGEHDGCQNLTGSQQHMQLTCRDKATYGVPKSSQTKPDASIVAAFVVDLQHADRRRGASRGEMGAAAGLSVEASDLDDANLAVGRRR